MLAILLSFFDPVAAIDWCLQLLRQHRCTGATCCVVLGLQALHDRWVIYKHDGLKSLTTISVCVLEPFYKQIRPIGVHQYL